MPSLDVRTTVLLTVLITILIAASLLVAARSYPPHLRADLKRWALSLLLQAMGWLLFGLRGTIDDLWSIVIANTLLAAAFVQAWLALIGFIERRRPHPGAWAIVAFAAAMSLILVYVHPSLGLRTILLSALYGVLFALCVRAIYRLPQRPLPPSYGLTAAIFIVLTVLMGLRIGAQLTGFGPTDPLGLDPVQAMVFAAGAFAPVIGTFGFLLMANDRLNEELARLATLDPLTGILNRRTLEAQTQAALDTARRHGQPLALAVIDADHFKSINDSYGHDAGDEALRALVGVLQNNLRSGDVLGRLGGEEFALLMPLTDEDAGVVVAERLRRAVQGTALAVRNHPIPLRVSIGVAARDDHTGFVELVRQADRALYAAKDHGRNRVMAASRLPLSFAF